MAADNLLIDKIVEQVIHRLKTSTGENVLLLCNRVDGESLNLPKGMGEITYFHTDDPHSNICFDRYILPRLEPDDLVDLASGKSGSTRVAGVLDLLLSGKKVEVLAYGHESYTDTAPAPLLSLYQKYKKTLIEFGLIPFAQAGKTSVAEGRLLSEREVERFHKEGVSCIKVPPQCLVTPLAVECAGRHDITLQREN